jgi:transglutaminase-like putative cysteine protease
VVSTSRRLHILHRTTFSYDRSVSISYNETRMRPAELSHQSVLYSRITATPATYHSSYVDYWGTTVTPFEVLTPHEGLTVLAESRVQVSTPPQRQTVGWDVLHSPELGDRMCEFLVATSVTEPTEEMIAMARDTIGDRSPSDAAPEILRTLRAAMEYVPGVTGVHTRAREAWEARKGVCQDIAHITLGALREVGIPARYVSGYLHPRPSAVVGEPVTGESHAWVEWFAGEWQGFDPTNNIEIGDRHVLVGRGRDYGDVPPLRGVYAGPFKSHLHVKVTITREA